MERTEIWWNESDYDFYFIYLVGRNVGKRGTYADGYIDGNICQVEDTDEWRGSDSLLRGAEQEFVRQIEPDGQQAHNIDDRYILGSVLDCAGHRAARVGSLRGGKTDELGACKCESGGDEDGPNTLESICKCSMAIPILCADVLSIPSTHGTTTAVEDDEDEDEHGDDEEFETR